MAEMPRLSATEVKPLAGGWQVPQNQLQQLQVNLMFFGPGVDIEFFIYLSVAIPIERGYRLASVHYLNISRNGILSSPTFLCRRGTILRIALVSCLRDFLVSRPDQNAWRASFGLRFCRRPFRLKIFTPHTCFPFSVEWQNGDPRSTRLFQIIVAISLKTLSSFFH